MAMILEAGWHKVIERGGVGEYESPTVSRRGGGRYESPTVSRRIALQGAEPAQIGSRRLFSFIALVGDNIPEE